MATWIDPICDALRPLEFAATDSPMSLPVFLHEFVEVVATRDPGAPALIESKRTVTYGELNGLANRTAQMLRSGGVEPGDRVVIALDNSVELVATYLGALKAGAVAVLLPAGPRSDRLAPAVRECSPRVAVVEEAMARAHCDDGPLADVPLRLVGQLSSREQELPAGFRRLAAAIDAHSPQPVAVPLGEDALAAIIYTSGSTGRPNGVMLSHRNFVANARSIVEYLGLTPVDRVLCVLPFYYVYGLSLLHTHFAVGGSVVLENRSAFPNVVLNSMREQQVTGFAGVPSTFALLLHRSSLDETPLPHLRYVTQAGGAMAPARILEWLERGPRADFYVMYGATEAAARLTYLPPGDLHAKLGSIGRPIPNVDITVVREDGAPASAKEVGELVARGANISRGYWNNPEETARRFSPLGYHTGDLGYADDDGYLFLIGRKHDMIKVGANRVGAKEIEDVLHQYPEMHEAAVVGAPHDLLGESPVAFVVLRTPLGDAANLLRGFCASRLPPYKVPVRIVELRELPKLAGSGKIDRNALRAWAAEAPQGEHA